MACCAFAVFVIAQIVMLFAKLRSIFMGQADDSAEQLSPAVAWYPGVVIDRSAAPRAAWKRNTLIAAAISLFAVPAMAIGLARATPVDAAQKPPFERFQAYLCGGHSLSR